MTTIGIQREVMPHVRFENKDYGRNEEASKQAGRHIPRNATFIIITSHGSKDSTENITEEWLPRKRLEASRGAYNLDWVEYFEKQYEAWKKGHELPREGTPVLTWQMLSGEQNSRLRALGITVVEDLAAIPDSGLDMIGLDGRSLRDMARAWIAEGQDKGINTRALADANVQIDELKKTVERQAEQLNRLSARLEEREAHEEPARRGPGRPRKDEAA